MERRSGSGVVPEGRGEGTARRKRVPEARGRQPVPPRRRVEPGERPRSRPGARPVVRPARNGAGTRGTGGRPRSEPRPAGELDDEAARLRIRGSRRRRVGLRVVRHQQVAVGLVFPANRANRGEAERRRRRTEDRGEGTARRKRVPEARGRQPVPPRRRVEPGEGPRSRPGARPVVRPARNGAGNRRSARVPRSGPDRARRIRRRAGESHRLAAGRLLHRSPSPVRERADGKPSRPRTPSPDPARGPLSARRGMAPEPANRRRPAVRTGTGG